MTDIERLVHPIVQHMGTHQKTALMKLARGERVGRQTIGSFESRGLIRRDEDGHITITEEGATALRLINQDDLTTENHDLKENL